MHSGALKAVINEFNKYEEEKASKGQFESGTLEGLMRDLEENNGVLVGIFDEFSTIKDNLDKGKMWNSLYHVHLLN